MISRESTPTFDSVSQRVAFSYQRQMGEFVAVVPDLLSPSEQDEMRASQRELDAFFRALYQLAYSQPETLGLPTGDDVYVDPGDGKKRKQEVTRQIKKARDKLVAGVAYLYFVGQRGILTEGRLRLAKDEYASFFTKGPRIKRKLVQGMQSVGLSVSEQGDAVLVGNTSYPQMMAALRSLAQICAQRGDQRLATLLFARCDYRALDADFGPDLLDLLQTALAPAECDRAVELHNTLTELGYQASLDVAGAHNWRVQYQGKRAIKSSAFLEYEYDERGKRPLRTTVKCAATNRLVPLLSEQSPQLQEDFFRHAHSCGAPKCSWCKTRKSLNPSVLEREGKRRTICWWMQRHLDKLDDETVDLVKQYTLLHEALMPA